MDKIWTTRTHENLYMRYLAVFHAGLELYRIKVGDGQSRI